MIIITKMIYILISTVCVAHEKVDTLTRVIGKNVMENALSCID